MVLDNNEEHGDLGPVDVQNGMCLGFRELCMTFDEGKKETNGVFWRQCIA